MLASLFNKVKCLLKFTEKKFQHRCFPVYIANFKKHLFWRTSANGCFWLIFYFIISLFVFCYLYNYKGKLLSFMARKIFNEIRLCNPMTHILKSMSKSFEYTCWSLKEKRNSFKEWSLNLWWISNKTIMEFGNITKAATFEMFHT